MIDCPEYRVIYAPGVLLALRVYKRPKIEDTKLFLKLDDVIRGKWDFGVLEVVTGVSS